MSAMKHFEQQSFYELLEVPVTASEEQILDAYARAMETYSPDSIAVYTLAEPEALEALRERLTQAMEVLCALEQRLEYDRKIGVTRSPEELARLRAGSLKRAAETPAGNVPANGAGEAPVTETAAQAQPAAEVKPEVQAVPAAAEEELPEAEVVTGEVVVVVEPVAEAKPSAPEPAAEPPAAEAPPAPAATPTESTPVPAAPTPAAVPVVPMAAKPGSLSRSLTPAPAPGLKPAIHARPMAPVARHGSAVPPPLPPRNGARAIVRAEAAPPPPSPPPRPGDSRTRLKTVVDIPSDAEFNGELLRQVRESRNLSLQMLADRTRISSRHVENIEADRYDSLPTSVYLRGMLMSIARELGLDPLRVSRSYMGLAGGEKKNR